MSVGNLVIILATQFNKFNLSNGNANVPMVTQFCSCYINVVNSVAKLTLIIILQL